MACDKERFEDGFCEPDPQDPGWIANAENMNLDWGAPPGPCALVFDIGDPSAPEDVSSGNLYREICCEREVAGTPCPWYPGCCKQATVMQDLVKLTIEIKMDSFPLIGTFEAEDPEADPDDPLPPLIEASISQEVVLYMGCDDGTGNPAGITNPQVYFKVEFLGPRTGGPLPGPPFNRYFVKSLAMNNEVMLDRVASTSDKLTIVSDYENDKTEWFVNDFKVHETPGATFGCECSEPGNLFVAGVASNGFGDVYLKDDAPETIISRHEDWVSDPVFKDL
jgi:hypothetical protein